MILSFIMRCSRAFLNLVSGDSTRAPDFPPVRIDDANAMQHAQYPPFSDLL